MKLIQISDQSKMYKDTNSAWYNVDNGDTYFSVQNLHQILHWDPDEPYTLTGWVVNWWFLFLYKQGVLLQGENADAGAAPTVRRRSEADAIHAQEGDGLERENGEELSDRAPREEGIFVSVRTLVTISLTSHEILRHHCKV